MPTYTPGAASGAPGGPSSASWLADHPIPLRGGGAVVHLVKGARDVAPGQVVAGPSLSATRCRDPRLPRLARPGCSGSSCQRSSPGWRQRPGRSPSPMRCPRRRPPGWQEERRPQGWRPWRLPSRDSCCGPSVVAQYQDSRSGDPAAGFRGTLVQPS